MKLGILSVMPEHSAASSMPTSVEPHSDDVSVLRQFAAQTETTTSSDEPAKDLAASIKSEKVETVAQSPKRRRFLPKLWHKVVFALLILMILLGAIGSVLAYYTYNVVLDLKSQALDTRAQSQIAYDAFKAQNLPLAQTELKKVEEKFGGIRQTYNKLSFYRYIPIARSYYNDGLHGLNAGEAGLQAGLQSLDTITPYADVLGFTGEGTFTGGTIEDRLKILLQTLDKVTPALDDIAKKLETVETELAAIDANRYPEKFRDIPVRGYIVQGQDLSKGAVTALTEFRPVIEELPEIAGGDGRRRKYLILFQNDNELRPTGGFLTAYSVIYVENGKVAPEKSDDIYEMDKKFSKNIPIPEALGRYLTTEKKWHLRDMNTSPDFKTSMDQFLTNYKTIKSEPQDLDGIIAVDTHVLTDLLKVLGPVEVPGYGTFSTNIEPKCDCPQIIYALSEIITRPTPYLREDRKGIIGPLMRAILTKAYTAPKQQWPDLFTTGFKSIEGRHTQMYFFDAKAQAAAEKLNAAGRLPAPAADQDFLAIVDANLGGAKSNLFIDYDVKQNVSVPENGVITKSLEITYKNNRKGDNCNLEAGLLCLNSTLRDWHRLYLPAGAKLVDAQGFTQTAKEYEEAGYSVIDGFFILEPNSQAKVKVTYTVPYTNDKTYKLRLWKQGGIGPIKHLIDVNGSQEEVVLDKDQTIEVDF
jgi:hypothetical protein